MLPLGVACRGVLLEEELQVWVEKKVSVLLEETERGKWREWSTPRWKFIDEEETSS